MISFDEARALIPVPTASTGWEDEHAYCVLLLDPPLDDLVTLVLKESGIIQRISRYDVQDRLAVMTPVERSTPE